MKRILVLVILLVANFCFAQNTFKVKIGGSGNDECYSIIQSSDSGYLACGKTNSYGAGGYDVYLVKTDAFGNLLWTKTFGTANDDAGYQIIKTYEGGYA